MPAINNLNDILDFLDHQVASVSWDGFYKDRKFSAPFILQNQLPDENLVECLSKNTSIKTAVEVGCGEGRNAIFMARQGLSVTAIDSSPVAITRAEDIAKKQNVQLNFLCADVIKNGIHGTYDFVYDSGLLHHLPPHRRITYIELLSTILKPGGYLGLTCFAWGENCADEVDDWEFYQKDFCAGLAFKKERLVELFQPYFTPVEIRKYQNGVPGTIQGLQFMWVCLFQDNRSK